MQDTEIDLALAVGGETLVVGRLGSAGDDRYGVLVVDPSVGAVLDFRPLAGTEEAGNLEAVALPDGSLVVAGDRPDAPPFLLLVDPVRGAVLSAAAIDVSDVAGAADRVRLDELTVSPDGSWIAVSLSVRAAGESTGTPAVAVVGTDPFSPGDAVALDGSAVSALAVADDGVTYVATEGRPGVLAVEPDAGTAREVPADLGEVTQVATVADQLVAVSRDLEVTRIDPADGSVVTTVDLCADTGAASGIGVAPDGALVVVANCAGAGLWVLPA